MATAQVSAEYAQDAIEFAADLDEDGYRCSFGTKHDENEAWGKPGDFVEIGKAAVLPGEWRADFSSDVRIDDRMFFVAPIIYVIDQELIPLGDWQSGIDEFGGYRDFLKPTDADAPSYTHLIDSDGKELKIEHIKRFRPDGVNTIYYEIQAR